MKAIINIKLKYPAKSLTEFNFSEVSRKLKSYLTLAGIAKDEMEISIAPEGYVEDCICCGTPGVDKRKVWGTSHYYSVCKDCDQHLVVSVGGSIFEVYCRLHNATEKV